jgi:hypothetical protein
MVANSESEEDGEFPEAKEERLALMLSLVTRPEPPLQEIHGANVSTAWR